MSIKEIVVHQGPDKRAGLRLEIAASLARRHAARLAGVFVKADPGAPEYSWMGFSKETAASMRSRIERRAAETETAFGKLIAAHDIEGEWRVMDGSVADAMITCARYADLTVIGQTDRDNPAYGKTMPDQVVLGAGGPVLVVPYAGAFEIVGRRVMVAWNGGREAVRAVRDAMPLLRQAETVIVHCVGPVEGAHLAGAEICTHLARHGVAAEASRDVLGPEAEAVSSVLKTVGGFGFQQRGPLTATRHTAAPSIDIGNALLSSIATLGVDLLVMGGYGHSRIRELVLGGTTREILGSMTVPVILSN